MLLKIPFFIVGAIIVFMFYCLLAAFVGGLPGVEIVEGHCR